MATTKFARHLFKNGITLSEIQKATGVSRPVLVGLKYGNRKTVSLTTILRISDYLEVEPSKIIERTYRECIKDGRKFFKDKSFCNF